MKKYRNDAFRTSLLAISLAFKKLNKALSPPPLEKMCGLAFDQVIFLQLCLQTDFFVNFPFSVLEIIPKNVSKISTPLSYVDLH